MSDIGSSQIDGTATMQMYLVPACAIDSPPARVYSRGQAREDSKSQMTFSDSNDGLYAFVWWLGVGLRGRLRGPVFCPSVPFEACTPPTARFCDRAWRVARGAPAPAISKPRSKQDIPRSM